jgi:membrane associated rhomboid family serine protease
MFPLRDNVPTQRAPVLTVTLVVVNVLAYFLWQHGGLTLGEPTSPQFLNNLVDWAAIPYEITHPDVHCDLANGGAVECLRGRVADQPPTWVTPFTAMFMHGGLLHLGGNMLFLWIFGNNIEDCLGPVRFIVFYLFGGLAAMALQVAIAPDAAVPTIGASGAIAGVLGGYLVLFPRARVLTLIFIVFFFTFIELPAMVLLGFWFLTQLIFGYLDVANPTGEGGGVAYFAHVGGFVFGILAIRLFAPRRKREAKLAAGWRAPPTGRGAR